MSQKPDLESSDCRDEYPPEVILNRLGLDVPSIVEKNLLDLGCGQNGSFVHWIRERDVIAIGLDRRPVISSPFLLQTEADAIPIPDVPYDWITAHFSVFRLGNSAFISALQQQDRLTDEQHNMNLFAMEQILDAMAWVTRPGSRAIIVPYPDALDQVLRKWNTRVENIFSNAGAFMANSIIAQIDPELSLGQRLIIDY